MDPLGKALFCKFIRGRRLEERLFFLQADMGSIDSVDIVV